MRNQLKIVYSALTIVAMLGLTSTVHGVPAFARQTGLDCNSCHAAAGWPVLNSFGQAFKAGGFTQASEDSLMGDGEGLSLPKSLNAAVIFKLRQAFVSQTAQGAYDKSGTVGAGKTAATTGPGVIDNSKTTTFGYNTTNMPDEWAIWVAGRAGKHVGFAAEVGRDADGKIGPLSFKVPLTWDLGPLKIGAVPYWTDAQGPGFGFENLSTGAVGNIKMFENGPAQSARMYIEGSKVGTKSGAATGLGLYVWHALGYVYYSPFLNAVPSDTCGNGSVTNASAAGTTKLNDTICTTDLNNVQFAHNLRVAVTPSFGGIDAAIGFQWEFGNWGFSDQGGANNVANTYSATAADPYGAQGQAKKTLNRVDYLGLDAQVLGTIGIPVALVATFGMADGTKNTAGNPDKGAKMTAWSVLLNATLVEDLLNLGVGYRSASQDNYVIKSTDAAGINTLEKAFYTPSTGTKTTEPILTDNQLIIEAKLNIARNLRLSATGYLSLNKVDVVDSKGDLTPTTIGSTGGNNGTGAAQENKLLVMLMGAF